MSKSIALNNTKLLKFASLSVLAITISACSSVPQAQNLSVSQVYTPAQSNPQTEEAATQRVAYAMTEVREADFMPYGGPVSAPTGFLEMCERSPVDCAREPSFDAVKIQTEARNDLEQKYRLALAGINVDIAAQAQAAQVQTASVDSDPAPAETASAQMYLSWPTQTAKSPLSFADYAPRLLNDAPQSSRDHTSVSGWTVDFAPQGRYLNDGYARLDTSANDQAAADAQPGAVSGPETETHYLSWAGSSPAPLTNTAASAREVPASLYSPSSGYAAQNSGTYDWQGLMSQRNAAPAANTPVHVPTHVNDYTRIDDAQMALVRSVNTEVNRLVRQDTDEDIYHVADYWVAPGLARGARGDCEDLALQKRRQLIEAGVPATALSIAIVKTYRGEDHAVLIVSMRDGDYVLDSLAYDVRPWRKAGYTWVSRQAPGDGLNWVSLAPANTSLRNGQVVRVAANW